MKKKIWIIFFLCGLLLSGCIPEPGGQASSDEQSAESGQSTEDELSIHDEPGAPDEQDELQDELSAPDEQSAQDEHWTLALYLCGSNLESRQGWGTKTIEELCGTALPEKVTVTVQTGGAKKWRNDTVTADEAGRYVIENGTLVPVETAPPDSMGEAETLAGFLNFCEENYPAGHTALVLWDHGGGPMKGACFDETESFDALTLSELEEALQAGVDARGGRKYDLVGFDACLMGSLETAALLADFADYMVASEEIESGAGWDYTVPLAAMSENRTPAEVAASVCDGYRAKCESRSKAAAATLAAVDLSRIPAVVSALDDALAGLREESDSKAAMLRYLAFRSRFAEAFGGATESEGLSNLIDLRGFAEAMDSADGGSSRWKALTDAVDAAVVRNINGSSTGGANGLSIWYPRSFSRSELSDYAAVSPLTGYAGTMSDLFSASLGQVAFEDKGSVQEDGMFSITIAPQAREAFYDLYVVNRRVDGDYMDVNVDLSDDWDNLSFAYDPGWAVAITLNGMVLDAQTIAYDYDHILFSCPITLNGEDSNLRVAWIWDTADSGHYELVGVWNGVDHVTGLSDRLLDQLDPGDVVGAVSLSTGEVRETTTLSGAQPVIEEIPMEPGVYECWFVCLDLHGNKVPSAVATYQVTGEGTRILSVE